MRRSMSHWAIATGLLAIVVLLLITPAAGAQPVSPTVRELVVGSVKDKQDQPVIDARVWLTNTGQDEVLVETETQDDGRFALSIDDPGAAAFQQSLTLHVERHHFEPLAMELTIEQSQDIVAWEPVALPDLVLQRRISLGFWAAVGVFVLMLVLIATSKMHNTLAALLGMALVLGLTYLGSLIVPDIYILDFEHALGYIDWNVIFLIMGMMIIIAVVEGTGIFQWLAFFAYRISGGRTWLLMAILMLITAVASAVLDNVTTMLLMTPITVQIALALNMNPLALLMPEVLASNVGGISTLVGTPTNILIGSYAGISFASFLTNLTPGVLLALTGLTLYSVFIYWGQLKKARSTVSPVLLQRLKENAQITQPAHLKKAGVVGLVMLILFLVGEGFHLTPAVTAMLGATALLVWIRPNIEEMIEAVDWTTLVFFMALFIAVGAIQEVGLISAIADTIGWLVGDNLVLAMLVIIWLGALMSTVIPNIPFTAAMLPVIGYLTSIIPGAENLSLFFCLSVGSAMGGNGSLIGASANLVTAGIAERAGYPITYSYFLKRGFPALLITVSLATLWLLLRFLVLG
ncbi:MAG: citrate transporter [Chloroflexi bacterium]|nr:citrate transporter [Chloroflexota bacterium]MBU1750096.1 citrate transporter [Chloroflexota bacterium]